MLFFCQYPEICWFVIKWVSIFVVYFKVVYAAFLPPMIAALFGSSRQLATGPVAIVSLMTAASLEPLATAGSEAFIAYAVALAFVVGLFHPGDKPDVFGILFA